MYDILVVEDERNLSRLIAKHLTEEGFAVRQRFDGTGGLKAFCEATPDCLVLDLMLPGRDGLSLCREVRRTSSCPVLILTAKTEEVDRVVGLETGADDYLGKPFGMRELVARIRALIRRSTEYRDAARLGDADRIREGDLFVDCTSREVLYQGNPVVLTRKEFDVLALLAANAGRVFNRDYILARVWDEPGNALDRNVDNAIAGIRKALRPWDGIETVWGIGYKLKKAAAHGA
jgi:DNA-binding response OmpR family regulator